MATPTRAFLMMVLLALGMAATQASPRQLLQTTVPSGLPPPPSPPPPTPPPNSPFSFSSPPSPPPPSPPPPSPPPSSPFSASSPPSPPPPSPPPSSPPPSPPPPSPPPMSPPPLPPSPFPPPPNTEVYTGPDAFDQVDEANTTDAYLRPNDPSSPVEFADFGLRKLKGSCVTFQYGLKAPTPWGPKLCSMMQNKQYVCTFTYDINNNCPSSKGWIRAVWINGRDRTKKKNSVFLPYPLRAPVWMFNWPADITCNSFWSCACPCPITIKTGATFTWYYMSVFNYDASKVNGLGYSPWKIDVVDVAYSAKQPDPYWSYTVGNERPFYDHLRGAPNGWAVTK